MTISLVHLLITPFANFCPTVFIVFCAFSVNWKTPSNALNQTMKAAVPTTLILFRIS